MNSFGYRVMRDMESPPSARSSSPSYAELNRQINAMAPHKEGADIVKYIKKLEADLTDIGCPRARFKPFSFKSCSRKRQLRIYPLWIETNTAMLSLKKL